MTDTSTETTDTEYVTIDTVAPEGVTKAEVVAIATSANPFAGNVVEPKPAGEARPGEPQRVLSTSDRQADVPEDQRPTTALSGQERIEQTMAEARYEQFSDWREPESLAEQKAEAPALIHAADEKPGGRLSDEAYYGVDYGLADEELDLGDLARDRADAGREAGEDPSAEPTGTPTTEEEEAEYQRAQADADRGSKGIRSNGEKGDTHTRAQLRDMSKTALRERAAELDVKGRSAMDHENLVDAVFAAERASK